MSRFSNARDAKEFLVARIVAEARSQGVPLSEVERQMLYFSETGWAPPDIMDISAKFDRECNQAEYDRRFRDSSVTLASARPLRPAIVRPSRRLTTTAGRSFEINPHSIGACRSWWGRDLSAVR
jgi:hypothetical protein